MPRSRAPPLGRGHTGVSGDPLSQLDQTKVGWGSIPSTSLHIGVVSGVFNEGGHYEPLVGSVSFIGMAQMVPDIDGVS